MEKPPAVGIDLGNTNSCVAVFLNGKVEIIPNDRGSRTTPSYVGFTDLARVMGESAKNQAPMYPTNFIFDSKRLIGRRFYDKTVQQDMRHWPFFVTYYRGMPGIHAVYKGVSQTFCPEEISSMVLTKMKRTAEAYLRQLVTNVVISVPASFNDSQRQATKDAATIAGLNVMQLINESTAAAIGFGLNKRCPGKRNVLIFDLGGGTLDVSLLIIENYIFTVKATGGNPHLGGEDFDNRMVDYFVHEFKVLYNQDLTSDKRALRRLRTACEQAKRTLSFAPEASIELNSLHDGIDFYTSITRDFFEQLNRDSFRSIPKLVKAVLLEAELDKEQVHDIVLVGGSTHIPMIQKMLQDFFNGKDLTKCINPDEVVAGGAAVLAAALIADKAHKRHKFGLLDVMTISTGIESAGGVMTTLFRRNSIIPAKKTLAFTTSSDNQSDMLITAYEGDHATVKYNRLLGKFTLTGIPPGRRGVPQIMVTFYVDASGILNVTAFEKTSGKVKIAIPVKYNKALLSKEEIKLIMCASVQYRMDEQHQRLRILAKNSLESYCYYMKRIVEDQKIRDKLSIPSKKAMLGMSRLTINWLVANQRADKVILEFKKNKLEKLCNPIITRIYRGTKGPPGGLE